MKKLLTATLIGASLLLTGCTAAPTVEYSSVADAKLVGKEYIDAVCQPMINDATITQTSVDYLTVLAARLNEMPPVEDTHGNDWLTFTTLAKALNDRATALQSQVGSPISAEDKKNWQSKCDYIFSTYTESFKDF